MRRAEPGSSQALAQLPGIIASTVAAPGSRKPCDAASGAPDRHRHFEPIEGVGMRATAR